MKDIHRYPCSQRTLGQMLKLVPWGICFAIALVGCRSTEFGLPDRWETYRNPRYSFEFPYPAGWQPADLPDNRDGIAFRDPQNPQVELRGWASFLRISSPSGTGTSPKLPASSAPTNVRQAKPLPAPPRPTRVPSPRPSLSPPNFTTEQGIQGTLQAQLGPQTSSLTLVLNHTNVQYYLRGSAPSQQFDAYYRFFNYVARRYRVPIN